MDTNRISVAAIGAIIPTEPVYLQVGEATIELRRKIPYMEVIDMTQWCIDFIINDRPFISAPLQTIVERLALVKFYTNIDCDAIMNQVTMEQIYNDYDVLLTAGVFDEVESKIDAEQLKFFRDGLHRTLDSIILYRNSARGMVDILADNANNSREAMEEVMKMYTDPDNAAKMKQLVTVADQISGK